jgi:hypothetical protein
VGPAGISGSREDIRKGCRRVNRYSCMKMEHGKYSKKGLGEIKENDGGGEFD